MKQKSKILLMIDDAPFRGAVEQAFKKLPVNALFAAGGNVMQKVFDEVPHLVVVDEDFANGEGHSLALNIKEDAVLKYIPVVLLQRGDALVGSVEEPIDLCFRKDQDPAHLAFCVGEMLKKNTHELDLNALTHLPGTRSSVLRLERAATSKKRFSICCVDLSDLSAFNSAYGVARGDEIIIQLGHILQEAMKKEGEAEDFVGHLGGDDFVIVTSPATAVQISEEIIRSFDAIVAKFYDANDRKQGYILQRNSEGTLTQYPIMSVSVALVQHGSGGAVQMSEISRIASELKRYMKTLPGSCYINYSYAGANPEVTGSYLEVRFPTKMESVRVPSLAVRSDKYESFLNVVLRGKKLQSVFQPIVDLKQKRIVGYEALTRCPDSDFASDPASLFSMAREAGRTKELDKICVDCALRSAQGLSPDRKIFLNLNHETLIDPKSMKTLFSEKGTIGFKSIVIEVTEQSILRSFQKVKDALLELKEQGVSVAIDDVGGGAVSLRDVAVLKPDFIKFDRSLIRQIDSNVTKQQIVLSMLLFANGINAMTTAEGIETKEEYDAVVMCGVPLGQGYFIARPGKAFPEIQTRP